MLDVAREQVADAGGAGGESSSPAGTTASTPAELPPPDPSSFAGAHRVVNLFARTTSDAALPTAIDVWARRTFTSGPVLLAEDIGLGEASEYFPAPTGHRLVVVSSGAGPDGEERGALPELADGEQATTVFTNGDDARAAATTILHERGSARARTPPADGLGLVVLVAANLSAFGDELMASVGADTFFVGDGSASCRTQRIEASGAAANVLGGPERVELETAPGPALITLHPRPSRNGCDQPSAIEITVDVVAGESTTVLVYTSDGAGLETLTLPAGG